MYYLSVYLLYQKNYKLLTICPFNQHYAFLNDQQEIEFGNIHYPEMPLLQYIYCKPSINMGAIIPEKEFQVLLSESEENIQQNMYPDAYISIKEALSINGFEKSHKALDLLYSIALKGEVKSISDIWFKYHIHEGLCQNVNMLFLKDCNKVAIPNQNKLIIWDIVSKETIEMPLNLPTNLVKMKWSDKNNSFSFILLNSDRVLIEYVAKDNLYKPIKVETRGNIIDFCIHDNSCCILDDTGHFVVMSLLTRAILYKEELGKTAKQIYDYPLGKNILIVHENFLQIFSLDLRTNQRHFKGSKAPINKIAFSSQGRYIAQTNIDGNTCIWNAFTSQAVSALPFDKAITSMQFSPNSGYLAIGDSDCNLSIIDLNTDSIVHRFKNLNSSISNILFSPNSRYILAAGYNKHNIAVLELNWDLNFHQTLR